MMDILTSFDFLSHPINMTINTRIRINVHDLTLTYLSTHKIIHTTAAVATAPLLPPLPGT